MNILILNDFASIDGGASKIALTSARALAERGYPVALFTAVGPVAPELVDVPNLQVHCMHQHSILDDPDPKRAARQGIWNGDAARALSALLEQFSPADTVLHLHTWTKALSASVVHAAHRRGFRIVLTLHDYFSACPNGGFYLYPQQQICTLRAMSPACIATNCDSRSYSHKLWRVGRQWTQTQFGGIPGKIDCFLTISDKSEAVLRPYLPADATVLRVRNPIDLPQVPPGDPGASDRFCFVGRLAPEKGPALLAESVAAGGFQAVFVGEGPERERIAQLAPDARITGWLAPRQTMDVLRASRALVFPSLWYETQGLAVTEAAALGVPAIVSSASAAREWVEDGVTGLVFQHGDRVSLQDRMGILAQDPELAQRMGMAAYQRYWQNASTMDRHCQELQQIYARTLAGRMKRS